MKNGPRLYNQVAINTIANRRAIYLIFAIAYSFGFALLEAVLQKRGIEAGQIAIIASLHNAISVLICACIFLKWSETKAKYYWAVGFVVVGLADLIHAVFIYAYPLSRYHTVLMIGDKLYLVFVILHLLALKSSFYKTLDKHETVMLAGIILIYLSMQALLISVPFAMSMPPLADLLAEIIYDLLSALIIAAVFLYGLTARNSYGIIFSSSYLLIFFSDFAIRYYDSVSAVPQLSFFNYGWELGFALIATTLLWMGVRKVPLENLFQAMPLKSLRCQMGGLTLLSLAIFAIVMIAVGADTPLVRAIDISTVLVIFMVSWILSNSASLWISHNVTQFADRLESGESFRRKLSNEVEILLNVYEEKNKTLASALKMLEDQKNAMESSFKYIAHDMRSPLSVFKSFMETAKSWTKDTSSDMVSAMWSSYNKLANMAGQMMDYAKAAGVNKRRVNISDYFAKSIIPEITQNARRAGVKMTANLKAAVFAELDEEKMNRAIVNIANNALQAVDTASGCISIELDVAQGDASSLIVTVSDNGCGMDEESKRRVFDKYFTKGKIGGTGLGLAYCKQVIEAHGGAITIESEVGMGTKFIVSLPNCVLKVEAENRGILLDGELTSTISPATGQKIPLIDDTATNSATSCGTGNNGHSVKPRNVGNVLIADDDFGARLKWIEIVEQLGGSVMCAAVSPDELMGDGQFDYSHVDAAVVDYKYECSDRTGIELIAYLKSKGVQNIHLCTYSYEDIAVCRAAREAGARSIISKPINEKSIHDLLCAPE